MTKTVAVELDAVRDLAALGMSEEEALAELGATGLNPATLPGFAQAFALGRALGRARLKRVTQELALAGDVKAIAMAMAWLDDAPPPEQEPERAESARRGKSARGSEDDWEDDGAEEPEDDIYDVGAIVVRAIEHPNGSLERYALRDPSAPNPVHPDEFPLKALPKGSPIQEQMRRRNEAIRAAAGITEIPIGGGPLPSPTLPTSGQAPPFSTPWPLSLHTTPADVGSAG